MKGKKNFLDAERESIIKWEDNRHAEQRDVKNLKTSKEHSKKEEMKKKYFKKKKGNKRKYITYASCS